MTAYDIVSPAAALEFVRPLCASPAWLDAMVARRPLRTLDRALEISDAVVAALSWPQVEQAVAADPVLVAAEVTATEAAAGDRVKRQVALRAAVAERVRDRLREALV